VLVELHHKSGHLCQPARDGLIRCPLLVRPTSEDVITGQIVASLRVLNPRLWLSDLLNAGLGARRFRRQVYRRLRIEPWATQPRFPRELLPFDEGSTQVDCQISWENPATTVYIEAKYEADLAPRVANDRGVHGVASDQLIRNARVGLYACGYFNRDRLFDVGPRDFVLLLLGPTKGHRLVDRYRCAEQFRAAIPHGDRLTRLPEPPFIGALGYGDVTGILRKQGRYFTRAERIVAEQLTDYLDYKLSRAHRQPLPVSHPGGPTAG